MRILLRLEVLKGRRQIPEPQYETQDYYAVTAYAPDLDEAAKKATRYMVDYLEAEHGLTRVEAYVLCSLVGDLHIAEVVDVPYMLVAMHIQVVKDLTGFSFHPTCPLVVKDLTGFLFHPKCPNLGQ